VRVPDHELLNYAEQSNSHLEKLHQTVSLLLLGTISQRGGASWIAVSLLLMNAPVDVIGGWQKRLGLVMWTTWAQEGGYIRYKEAYDVVY
jgi:hypothetical protein